MSRPAPVRFDGVKKRFGETEVLRGIDLEVAAGECLVLLGPSGCGKTTLLRLVAGLEKPDAGTISIAGAPVDNLPPSQRDVAMVFQNYALYPHLSAFENLAFPLRARRAPAAQIEPRVRDAARRLQIEALLDRRPAQLSGGQQQRVALGRALVRNPAVFIMDEPLSNLDAKLRYQTRTELKRLQQELGTTTLYVTHDQSEAMTLGDRVALLRSGVLEQVGAPLELYRCPANRFVAGFLGSPSINFLPAERTDGRTIQAGGATLEVEPRVLERLDGSHEGLEVGVRPEDMELQAAASPGFGPAVVVTVEPMGNETLVALDATGVRIMARAPADFRARPGDRLFFRPLPGKSLFFSSGTGARY